MNTIRRTVCVLFWLGFIASIGAISAESFTWQLYPHDVYGSDDAAALRDSQTYIYNAFMCALVMLIGGIITSKSLIRMLKENLEQTIEDFKNIKNNTYDWKTDM